MSSSEDVPRPRPQFEEFIENKNRTKLYMTEVGSAALLGSRTRKKQSAAPLLAVWELSTEEPCNSYECVPNKGFPENSFDRTIFSLSDSEKRQITFEAMCRTDAAISEASS